MERRREGRIETNVAMMCRAPARPCRAVMHDVSHGGCHLEFPTANIELGGTAVIDVPGIRQITGTIVWVHGNNAGVRFERHLSKSAAVALGLEEAEAATPLPDLPSFSEKSGGMLRHWIRRLTGF